MEEFFGNGNYVEPDTWPCPFYIKPLIPAPDPSSAATGRTFTHSKRVGRVIGLLIHPFKPSSMPKGLLRLLKGISLRFVIIAGIFFGAAFLFAEIADDMVLENENHFDRVVFRALELITTPTMTEVMVIITFFGSAYFLTPAYVLLVLLFLIKEKNNRTSLNIAAIGISSTIILFSLKAIFHRSRPLDPLVENVDGFSFPSGHAFSAFTFFGLLIYILWTHPINPVTRWVASSVFFLSAFAVAVSRVYLHVHFASDVVAGFLLCVVWLLLSLWLLNKVE